MTLSLASRAHRVMSTTKVQNCPEAGLGLMKVRGGVRGLSQRGHCLNCVRITCGSSFQKNTVWKDTWPEGRACTDV